MAPPTPPPLGEDPPPPLGEDPPEVGEDGNSDISVEYHPLSRQFCGLGFQLEGFLEDAQEATPQEAPTFIDRVENVWSRIEPIYLRLLEIAPDNVIPTVNKDFRTAQSNLSKIMRLLSAVRPVSSPPMTPQSTSSTAASVKPDVKLPRVELPTFGGSIAKWPAFSANFQSILNRYPLLTDEDKLSYLKSALKGNASDIIDFIVPGTPDAFTTAWGYLENRYANKREIAYDTVRKIVNYKATADKDLENLIDRTRIAIQTLEMMGLQASSASYLWNPIILDKIDSATRTAWDQTHVDDSIPSTDQLLKFLQLRAKSQQHQPRSSYSAHQPSTSQQSNNQHSSSQQSSSQQSSNQQSSTQSNQKGTTSTAKKYPVKCPECLADHQIFKCPVFSKASVEDREVIARNHKLCINCLYPGHGVKTCTSKVRCRTCDKSHHSMLHKFKPQQAQTNLAESAVTVLRPTALLLVKTADGDTVQARAIIDGGSTLSFMTEKLHARIGAKTLSFTQPISCLGGASTSSSKVVRVEVCSSDQHFSMPVTTALVPSITTASPSAPVTKNFRELQGATFADPNFNVPGPVDILLGAETLPLILCCNVLKLQLGPVAQETKFGWIVTGPAHDVTTTSQNPAPGQTNCAALDRFWEIEDLPKKKILTKDEQKCEDIFRKTTKILANGRYSVDLPFKKSDPSFGASRPMAVARFKQLEKRFARDENFKLRYIETIQDYLDTAHMIRAPVCEGSSKYYLPHHGVLSGSKKLRVVFDGSATTSSGNSLNSELLNGPTVQSSLFNILVKFRIHPVAFCGDVQQMYRQVFVNSHHQNFQRIVWRDNPDSPLEDYVLTTVTWGTKSAPFLATRVLCDIAERNRENYPVAASCIQNDFYVDDLLSGMDSEENAATVLSQIQQLLAQSGFTLHKIASNRPIHSSDVSEKIIQDESTNALGIKWKLRDDLFAFLSPNVPPRKTTSKRAVLSDAGRLFDPLGWITPITVTAKLFIQKLWLDTSLTWDSQLPDQTISQWRLFTSSLQDIAKFHIPRHCPVNDKSTLCGFADASEKAYAAVVYLRTVQPNGDVIISLLAGKSKVAPLKKICLPRLELCALLLLASLVSSLQEALSSNLRCLAWTDSTIALGWASAEPSKWKTFVANRVTLIQESIDPSNLRHVRSEENPADIASRGTTPDILLNHDLWWQGPKWLLHRDFDKPTPILSTTLEERGQSALVITPSYDLPVFSKISNFSKLVKIIALVKKFIALITKQTADPQLHATDWVSARMTVFKAAQSSTYSQEITDLRANGNVKLSSSLSTLDPFLDHHGVLRVGGRLKKSSLSPHQVHPIMMPRHHHITYIYSRYLHLSWGHVGPMSLIAQIRQRAWVPAIRNLARKIVNTCTICARLSAQSGKQMMADLPRLRVTPARPFTTTGVDMAGPFSLKTHLTRGTTTYKSYMAIFICFATRAVHLELVSTLAADGFLAAFQRFTARRGVPLHIKSDQGTNFIASAKVLKTLQDDGQIQDALSSQGVSWSFNPPAAPHWGGLWEAGVKSAKYHLTRIIGDQTLTFEEMYTVLCRVEAIMNSRPLTDMQISPNDEQALTPAHFLIGSSLTAPPIPDASSTIRQRWRLVNEINQHFWRRWSAEYLTRLQQRPKWARPKENLKIGELVLIKEDNLPPLQWRLGRISELHTSSDGLVRAAKVKTQHREFDRPVTKICRLPLFGDEPSPSQEVDSDDAE